MVVTVEVVELDCEELACELVVVLGKLVDDVALLVVLVLVELMLVLVEVVEDVSVVTLDVVEVVVVEEVTADEDQENVVVLKMGGP